MTAPNKAQRLKKARKSAPEIVRHGARGRTTHNFVGVIKMKGVKLDNDRRYKNKQHGQRELGL